MRRDARAHHARSQTIMDRRLLDYTPVLETFGSEVFEREAERAAQAEAPAFDEAREFALATELLAVRSEAQLRSFLIRVVAQAGGVRLPATPLGQALIRLLRRAALPVLLPLRRSASLAALPGSGGNYTGLGSAAQLFGLELEGLSPEDKEFALARQFVRFAGKAAANAAHRRGAPQTAAAEAVREAARDQAPGLLRRIGAPRQYGRWIRRGGQIVVIDC
ncbi:MAG TPA: hypothetical protein VF861_13370 [Telluria sp.]